MARRSPARASPCHKGVGSALQRALISWFLDVHTRENGFTEIWPPAVVNAASARGTGQIPDKEDQMYVVTRDDLYLIPTAEVPVTNLHRDEILEAATLPIRYAAYTPCFRREAGAAGKDTRGILRVHQFDKVEMVLFERPEASAEALEWMTGRAEDLLQRLGLAYRVLLMATRDMGFVQAKKYDLEVWARPASSAGSRCRPARTSRLPSAPHGDPPTAPEKAARPSSCTPEWVRVSPCRTASPRSSRRTSSATLDLRPGRVLRCTSPRVHSRSPARRFLRIASDPAILPRVERCRSG